MTDKITGQMFVRKACQDAPDGRKLVIAMAILALPEGVELGDESMVEMYGEKSPFNGNVVLTTVGEPWDVSKSTRGEGPGGVLQAPIWRV